MAKICKYICMTKLTALTAKMVEAVKSGHCGIFSTEDLALMLGEVPNDAFRKYLYKAVRAAVIVKVARNLYYSPVADFEKKGVLERIARLIHWRHFIYVSLESELSRIGRISQIPMRRLTVMTTGRSGKIETPFGVIEFTHTRRKPDSLSHDVYLEPDTGIFRAKEARAIADLKRVGRNVNMLEEEV